MDLYSIKPIPFVLPLPVEKEMVNSYVETVDYCRRIIVTNQGSSVAYEIDEAQMNECTLLGTTYYCHQIVQRKVTTTNSCGLAIFRG